MLAFPRAQEAAVGAIPEAPARAEPRDAEAHGAAVGGIAEPVCRVEPPVAHGARVEGIPVALCICGSDAFPPEVHGALVPAV